jgi:flagellar motor protein MotB
MTSPIGLDRNRISAGTLVRLVAMVCVAVFLAGLAGCVSADEHKRLQTAFDESQTQLAKAERDLSDAQKQIATLNAKIAELNGLLEMKAGGTAALVKERDLLQTQLAELQKKYDDLLKLSSTPVLPVGINNMLRDLAAQYPDLLEFDEKLGMIRMKSEFTFDAGSTDLKPEAKRALALLAQILNNPAIARNEIQVVGHTDDIPIRAGGPVAARNPDNGALSTNRAWSVLSELRTDGVSQDRGMAGGWGDQRPIAPNGPNRTGNVKNRRVDIFIRATTVPEGIVVSTPGAGVPARPATRPATRPAAPATGAGGVPLPR